MSSTVHEHRSRKRPLEIVELKDDDDDSDLEEIPVKQPRNEQPYDVSLVKKHMIEFLHWMKPKVMLKSFISSALKALGYEEESNDEEENEVEIVDKLSEPHDLEDRENEYSVFDSTFSRMDLTPKESFYPKRDSLAKSVFARRSNFSSIGNQNRFVRDPFDVHHKQPFIPASSRSETQRSTSGFFMSSLNHSKQLSKFDSFNCSPTTGTHFFSRSSEGKKEEIEYKKKIFPNHNHKLLDRSLMIKDKRHIPFVRRKDFSKDEVEIIKEVPPSDVLLSRTKLVLLSKQHSTPMLELNRPANDYSLSASMKSEKSSKFTASSVVDWQEKEAYRLLLDSYYCGTTWISKKEVPCPKSTGTQVNSEDIDKSLCSKSSFSMDKYIELYQPKVGGILKSSLPRKPPVTRPVFEEVAPEDEVLYLGEKPFKYKERPGKLIELPNSQTSTYFSPEWLRKLRIVIDKETEERARIIEEQKREVEEYRRKVNAEIEAKALAEAALKDFPELTPEMERIIDNALVPNPPDEILSQLSQHKILRKDMETLNNRNWLNDEVINYYLMLIVDRSKQPGFPSVYSFNTFFYTSLKTKGFSLIRRWTRRVDIFSYDMILIPVHLGVHWCLAVIDFRYKRIAYYDSMGGKDSTLDVLKNYLNCESLDKRKKEFDFTGWSLEAMKKIPPQMNGYDCGMFTLKYAEYVTRDAPITFTQQNMQYFRRTMVYEIIKRKIL